MNTLELLNVAVSSALILNRSVSIIKVKMSRDLTLPEKINWDLDVIPGVIY